MRPEHLELLYAVGRPSPTPDGTGAVIAVAHPDLDADRSHSELWIVATDDGLARRLTAGPRDSAPAVSPDGVASRSCAPPRTGTAADPPRRARRW